MKLHVGSDIVVRTEADCPIVAMLRPASGLAQWLSSETYVFEPWVPTTEYVDSFGNLCERMVVPRGDMRLRVEATVETEPLLAIEPSAPFTHWFEAYIGGRWYTFDATQPQPSGGRVVLAYGRDAADVALISNYGPLTTIAMKVWVELAPPASPLPPAPAPIA